MSQGTSQDTSQGTSRGASQGSAETEQGPDLVALGETMGLVAATGTGPFTVGSPARMSFGGAESNVAIGVSRLGHRAAWIGRLGADPIGTMIVAALRAEGIDTSRVRLETEVPTGLMLREHRTTDRVRVSYYRRALAGSRLAPEDVEAAADLIGQARLLHVSGITPALSSTARAAARRAIELARAAGVRVSFDLNYRAALWGREQAAEEFGSLVPLADVVFAGIDEAALLSDAATAPERARALAASGPSEVVVARGALGAVAYVDGSVHEAPALPVSAVDPVGAGDAFVAGYLSALLDGEPAEVRLTRANVCGAFAVSVAGDWEGAPRRSELRTLDGTENVAR